MPKRNTKRRRPNGAEDKVARRAKYRKSANAQSKQIVSLAKSINSIKHELKDHSVPLMWENNLQQFSLLRNDVLGSPNGAPYTKTSNICVIPLTSVGDPASGAVPSTQDASQGGLPTSAGGSAHVPIQPYGRDIGETNQPHVGASWMKLYNQQVHMCFRQNNLNQPIRYKLFVVRLARPEDGSALDSTMLALRKRIDGISFAGCPDSTNTFVQGEDFYGSSSWIPNVNGSIGAADEIGCALPSMNSNRYVVEHQRSFVLGPMPRAIASTSAVVPPTYGAVLSTPEARDYYECKFNIKYGGVKIMAPNITSAQGKEQSQTITDIRYRDLRSDILRWCVVVADRTTIEGSNASSPTGVPVYTLRSSISSRVPA